MAMSDNDVPKPDGERIAKRMARAGLCSRREAERWIEAGRVRVNGEKLQTPAVVVTPSCRIEVDGKPLAAAEPTRLWRYHKPPGLITTDRDPEGRRTVFEALPKTLPRVMSVGRLDYNSEGLLLLTNDGALSRHLEHPRTGWTRRYRVRVHGHPAPEMIAELAAGIQYEGVRYAPLQATVDRLQGGNAWLTLALKEGKNREIRKVLESFGLAVNRLIRVNYGPFTLGDLALGDVAEVKTRILADQLGSRAAEFGIVQSIARKPAQTKKPRHADRRRKV